MEDDKFAYIQIRLNKNKRFPAVTMIVIFNALQLRCTLVQGVQKKCPTFGNPKVRHFVFRKLHIC